MDKTLSAKQAAEVLGISLPSLYAYVSRGLLRSVAEEGARSKRYLHEDILRLAARKSDSRRAGRTAENAIDWGVPILESSITLIADGKLRYRGHDVLQLAASASLEETAKILWNTEHDYFSVHAEANIAEYWLKLLAPISQLPPLDRAMALLPAVAPQLQSTWGRTETAMLRAGAQLMQVLAAALTGSTVDGMALHEKIAQSRCKHPEDAERIRAALVVCADHELNASTFTVRCVASTGAHLYACVTAGLAALSGPRHGGETLRVRALLDNILREPDPARYLAENLHRNNPNEGFSRAVPGFGHPLYPEGDPRGKMLLSLLPYARMPQLVEKILAIAAAAELVCGERPNLDFGLAALEVACEWPAGTAHILFALGRSAGWIAHAIEQIVDGRLIRPRARYVGNFDFAD